MPEGRHDLQLRVAIRHRPNSALTRDGCAHRRMQIRGGADGYSPGMENADVKRLTIDTIRGLAMDMVEQANARHPGTAMALAPLGYLLFRRLRANPADLEWPSRDRFVLSVGPRVRLAVLPAAPDWLRPVRRRSEAVSSVGIADSRASRAQSHPGYRSHHRSVGAGFRKRGGDRDGGAVPRPSGSTVPGSKSSIITRS
jgi:Transketolase, thiamine diphosphate binding domain